jgi:hypothetical protein
MSAMAYELEGTLKEVFAARTFGKGFTKREFIITTSKGPEDRYPQHIKLSFVKDRCSLLDRYKPGQRVKVSFELRGSEYNGKYFTELQAWRIEPAGGDGPPNRAAQSEPAEDDEGGEGMPF